MKIVFYRCGISGGTATLAMRLGKKLIEGGHDVYYLFYENNNINNVESMQKIGIKAVQKEKIDLLDYAKKLCLQDECKYICYTLKEYVELALHIGRPQFYDIYIYHTADAVLGIGGTKFEIKKRIKGLLCAPLVRQLYINKKILIFNEKCDNEIRNTYGLNGIAISMPYYPIPIESEIFSKTKLVERYKENNFNIIAIARAEFPFKNYLFGLIKTINSIVAEGSNVFLQIVSSGSQTHLLQECIDALPEMSRSRIKLDCDIKYDQLSKMIGDYHLNVGMGTTLLDASAHYVPSLIAKDFSDKEEVRGLFADFGTIVAQEGDSLLPMKTCIENVYNLSEDDYIELCIRDNQVVREQYGLENVVRNLIKQFEDPVYTPEKWRVALVSLFK